MPPTEAFTANGSITLSKNGRFGELEYSFPLKLMAPRLHSPCPHLGVCYVLSFGGGLVSGDAVLLEVRVEAECTLLILTQGTTKVFKMRGQMVPTLSGNPTQRTMQSSDFLIASSASLFLLPSAVTCFADASYSQKQRFQLEDSTASLILLDAFTSGRMARDEEWQFQCYRSENEVFIGEERVLKDVMLLEAPDTGGSISDAMAGYSCFANLFLFGPATIALQDHLTTLFRAEMQYRSSKAPPLLWSYAELLNGKRAGVVRVAGTTTEAVMTWLAGNMGSLEGLLGPDLFRQVWS